MNFKLIPATSEYNEVMKNLMQFYMYDFSEYIKSDVESEGLFGAYPNLEDYWKKENHRFPYFIKEDERYIGFVLVRLIKTEERSYFSIAEFFIMKKYRRKGIGKAAAGEVFNLHRGQWEVYQKESNQPARVFWNRVIDKYTRGQYGERLENGRSIQDFEN